jgi:alpha-L-fucosidase 2
MSDLNRRQLIKLGAGVALTRAAWPATALAEVRAAGDLALWYDKPAGSEWLRALPVGNGRLGRVARARSPRSASSCSPASGHRRSR